MGTAENTITLTIPEIFILHLEYGINSEEIGEDNRLQESEVNQLEGFIADTKSQGYDLFCYDIQNEEPFFSGSHDLSYLGFPSCNCYEIKVIAIDRDWQKIARELARRLCSVKKECEKGTDTNEAMRVGKGYDLTSDYMMECEEIEDHIAEATDEAFFSILGKVWNGERNKRNQGIWGTS